GGRDFHGAPFRILRKNLPAVRSDRTMIDWIPSSKELAMGLMNRRDFIAAGAAVALSAAAPLRAGASQDPVFKKKIKKAFITGPDEDSFKRARDNGFDGVQLGSWNHKPEDARKAREAAEKHG